MKKKFTMLLLISGLSAGLAHASEAQLNSASLGLTSQAQTSNQLLIKDDVVIERGRRRHGCGMWWCGGGD